MSFIQDMLMGKARAELKSRTDEILGSMDELGEALGKNTRLMKKVIGGGVSEKIRSELKSSIQTILEQESRLDKALHSHIEAMKNIVESL